MSAGPEKPPGRVRLRVNGVEHSVRAEPRMSLADLLRDELRLTGTHVGCEQGACGACTVLLDGVSVRSCLLLAVQADGCEVTTVEGLPAGPLRRAFTDNHALQCGFCTPGMIMQALDLLAENPNPDEQAVREGLEGNLCRCTGYQNIVRAVLDAAQRMRPGAGPEAERTTDLPVGTPRPRTAEQEQQASQVAGGGQR